MWVSRKVETGHMWEDESKENESKGEGYEKGEKQRASKQKSLGDRFSDMADPLTSQSWGSWGQRHILGLLRDDTLSGLGCQQVGVGVKWRPGLPVSPLFIYHQSPPTTEESMLNWITDNGVERHSESRSKLYSLLLTLKRSLNTSNGSVCVCRTIS